MSCQKCGGEHSTMACDDADEQPMPKAQSSFAAPTLLACGHPGHPNNLKVGACGTCWMVADLERMAKESSTPKLRRILRALANQFRSGNVIYDTNGKSFLEWEKAPTAVGSTHLLDHNVKMKTIETYTKRPSNLLFQVPTVLYLVAAVAIKPWWLGMVIGIAQWAILLPIISACIWKHDFGTWKFWR